MGPIDLPFSERPSSLALYWRSPAPGGITGFLQFRREETSDGGLTVTGKYVRFPNPAWYGKPPTFSTQDTTQLKRAIDMTDDELVQIITQAKPTVVK